MPSTRVLWLCLSIMTLPLGLAAVRAEGQLSASIGNEDVDVSESPPVISRHTGTFHGRSLAYTATAGRMAIPGPDGSIDAQMFFVAYTLDGASPDTRPVTFLSNGGPGAATSWLHLGGIGPRKIRLRDDGSTLPSPPRVVANPDSILDRTDLVFIDATGTGFSRASSEAAKVRLFDKHGDLESYAKFIEQYLARNKRWGSPLFLFGESYGGMRMAGLTDVLIRRGIPLKGIMLLSADIDEQVLEPGPLNDLPYQLLIPSFATVAAYHGLIDPGLARDGETLRRDAQAWASTEYGPALAKGNRLDAKERAAIVAGLARYTGLSERIIETENLRVTTQTFMKYLMKQPGIVVGRVDGRIAGPAPSDRVEEPWYDPAMGSMTPAFTSATNQYLTSELHYPSSIPYRMYSREVASRFTLGPAAMYAGEGYPQALTALQSTAVKDADFKILTMAGIYDIACPYWAIEYSLDHMVLPASYRDSITSVRLDGGHMAYTDQRALREIGASVTSFIDRGMAGVTK